MKINTFILVFLTGLVFCGSGSLNECIKGLKSRKLKVKQDCAQKLGEMREKDAVAALIESLDDSTVAFISARSLGLIRDKRAIEPLAAAIFYGNGAGSFNRMAVWALGELCAVTKIELLRELLAKPNSETKMNSEDVSMVVKVINNLEDCEK